MLRVYSGGRRQCDVGVPTGIKCLGGEELYTGDIVVLLGNHFGEPASHGLTVVTSDQWQSYSDGSNIENLTPKFFVMGIKSVDVNEDNEWAVWRVKSFYDVIDGEHWKNYGFNYRNDPTTTQKGNDDE